MGSRLIGDGAVLFIGVGAMGEPMAARIAQAGFDLAISDLDTDRTASIAASFGADFVAHQDLAAKAARFRTVITMLPSSAIVEAVLLGDSALLENLAPGTVVIDMSSSVPASTVSIAGAAASRGVGYIDAPVSGGVPKARTGELALMIGGDASVIESRRELFDVMGAIATHVGGSGTGHAMKALNNLLSAVGMAAAAEVLAIGVRFGIDAQVALDVINSSTGRNQATEVKYERYILSGAFDSGFAMKLMVKDLKTAIELAHDGNVPAPVSVSVLEEWIAAFGALGPQADHTEIAAYVEERAGLRLAGEAAGVPE